MPQATGSEWWQAPNDTLEPVANNKLIRDKVSVLSNFRCAVKGIGHHSGRAQILTGTYDPNQGKYGGATGPSLDFHISAALEGQTRFRSIDIGISKVGKIIPSFLDKLPGTKREAPWEQNFSRKPYSIVFSVVVLWLVRRHLASRFWKLEGEWLMLSTQMPKRYRRELGCMTKYK